MAQPTEMLIRERAYSIWLREGCPQEASDRNWAQAQEELAALDTTDPIETQPDGETPSEDHAAIVAGPEGRARAKTKKPAAKRKEPDHSVLVAGPEAHSRS